MKRSVVAIAPGIVVVLAALAPSTAFGQASDGLVLPWSREHFIAEEGCRWELSLPGLRGLRHNAHYIAPPGPGEDWKAWLQRLRAYRETTRAHLRDAGPAQILLQFDGVRAWVRTDRRAALAADLAPGQRLVLKGQAQWLAGNNKLCLAFDWCDRGGGAEGPWRGWSAVVASASIPQDGAWHDFEIAVEVPRFAAEKHWARPILGMDGTFDAKRGSVALRQLTLTFPHAIERAKRLQTLRAKPAGTVSFDDSIYRRDDLGWMTRNFVCGFLFVYDRSFWDPEQRRYRVAELCDEAQREFGGYDSVVLWHAYPRIGADDRNQFDFFRDMPGGLAGVRYAVQDFHHRGVKVFLPYNPWDTGTRREKEPDEEALAHLVAALEADGLFLDTMIAAPGRLRETVDAARPGVAFEPEGHPSIEEMERCSGSWAQWLAAFPEIGVLHLKWLEPRHIQHQIRRWNKSHQDELAAAWLNGSGVLVWENIFGYWNPWNAQDRATLRRMAAVLRHFAPLFTEGEWLPYYPTKVDKVYASCWRGTDTRLWTLVNQSGRLLDGAVLETEDRGETFFDLWRGELLKPQRAGGKVRLSLPLGPFGAVVATRAGQPEGEISALLARQRQEAQRPVPRSEKDPYVKARSVIEPKSPPVCPPADAATTAGMLKVDGGQATFVVRHMRRECGCYPDPGTPPAQWDRFLTGNPHTEVVEHRVAVTLGPCWIDPKPVTNAQFEVFLKASGYVPRCRDRFLHHWGGPTCPDALKDKPVVCVDLEDARAYAAWAKKRLPTEWEWQRAAERHGDAFRHSEVFEWTESERDDGHCRFVLLRGGSRYKAEGSIWYFPGGPQPIQSHAKFLLMNSGLDRCATIGFRCVAPESH